MLSASMPEITHINQSVQSELVNSKTGKLPRHARSPYTQSQRITHFDSSTNHNKQIFLDFPLSETSEWTKTTDESETDDFQDFSLQQSSGHTISTVFAKEIVTDSETESTSVNTVDHEHEPRSQEPKKGIKAESNAESLTPQSSPSILKQSPYSCNFDYQQRNDALQYWSTPSAPEPFHLSEVMFMITRDVEAFKNIYFKMAGQLEPETRGQRLYKPKGVKYNGNDQRQLRCVYFSG
ncbi:unnamed protein product [Allacma fusca]|uniref:Uncharacterized protein n=1 Tax=Allacma fusca TaxID=39272 RepID=A0A8J2Q217_9HEXA|nr:unnamed protein product [Allacma fusca]